MMDSQYTTVSKTDSVDGWLAIMIGDALWYPLWDAGQVGACAAELAKLVNRSSAANGLPAVHAPSTSASPLKEPTPAESVPVTVAAGAPVAQTVSRYDDAWAIITDKNKAIDADKLRAFLADMGLDKAEDLEFCDESQRRALAANLKPVMQKKLIFLLS
jgi:hypothetical protein